MAKHRTEKAHRSTRKRQDGKRNKTRPGRRLTPKLYKSDFELLKNLKHGNPAISSRYAAAEQLVSIVESIELTDMREDRPRQLAFIIPPALDEAIKRKQRAIGQTFITILIAAAREYRRRHPLAPETTSENLPDDGDR